MPNSITREQCALDATVRVQCSLRLDRPGLFLHLVLDTGTAYQRHTLTALQAGMAGRSTMTLTTSTDRCLHQRLWRSPGAGAVAIREIWLQLHVILVNVLGAFHDTCFNRSRYSVHVTIHR